MDAMTGGNTSEASRPQESLRPHDIESPIPQRTAEAQYTLTQTLLVYPTLAERLAYLFANESYVYLRDEMYVIDPSVIAANLRGLVRKQVKGPFIADWVRKRTGLAFTKSALYQFKDGDRKQPRPSISNGLAEFWRVDYLLLDPTVPASRFEDPRSGASELDPLERRIDELMGTVGLEGVKPRQIKQSLRGATDATKRQFLGVLQGIAREQQTTKDSTDD